MSNFKTETVYIVSCNACKKEMRLSREPRSYETHTCKNCINKMVEPTRKEFPDFKDYLLALSNYQCLTEVWPKYYNDGDFKGDLFKHFGVEKNKKAGKAYEIAYEQEHSSGYYEIFNYFETLIDLIK